MIKNGFAAGGLLADASRTWRMEAEYPEFEKGVANRLSKERVPEAEIEEQFNYSPLQRGYAEGGEIDFDTEGSMLDPEIPLNFEEDYSDRGEASDFPAFEEEILAEDEEDILTGLSPEDQEILFQALSDYPELKEILNTISANDSSASFDTEVFDDEGSVEGPGTGTSDSIPANLSDGEFVFTAKAVKQLGVDKLRKMMAKAEEDYEYGEAEQTMAQLGSTGFAAGGLLTKTDSFSGGGPVSGGVSRKHLGYGGGTYTHGQILKMAKTYGKGFMKNVKRTADGKFRVIGFKYGGKVSNSDREKELSKIKLEDDYIRGKSINNAGPVIKRRDYPLGVTDKEGHDKMINQHYDEWSPSDGIPGEGNPHIGEESIMGRERPIMKKVFKGLEMIDRPRRAVQKGLGTILFKLFGLDPVTYIPKGRDGKPDVGRESSLFTET